MAQARVEFNHVGISVPAGAGKKAADWYMNVFGFKSLVPFSEVRDIQETDTAKIYGPELASMNLAILLTDNDVAFEIFEFVEPPYEGPPKIEDWSPRTYLRPGVFHVCFTVSDVDVVADKIISEGGSQVGERISPGDGAARVAYMQDPWGNVVELLPCNLPKFFEKVGGSAVN